MRLLGVISTEQRLVVVEDTRELAPLHPHVVLLQTRPPNIEGAGAVSMRDLVRQTLRMRPDRLVVGEVRGAEVVDLLTAFNTGHEGGCGTVHANSAADVVPRLEALAALGGLRREALHRLVVAAIDAVVHLDRAPDGHRYVSTLASVVDATDTVGIEPQLTAAADGTVNRPRRRAGEPRLLSDNRMRLLQVVAAVCAAAAVWWRVPAPPTRGPFRLLRNRRFEWVQTLASWRRRRPHRSQARTVGALTAALASELRSGQPPDRAMQSVLGGWGGPIPGRYVPDSDVVTLLHRWACIPGWGGLAAIAICWRVADSTGAGLADALDRIGEAMRHEYEVAAEVEGQLASVRATASVLVSLPAVAVAMGHLLGAKPIAVLFGTVTGAACLAVGAVFAGTGWWWLTHQVESVRKTLRW